MNAQVPEGAVKNEQQGVHIPEGSQCLGPQWKVLMDWGLLVTKSRTLLYMGGGLRPSGSSLLMRVCGTIVLKVEEKIQEEHPDARACVLQVSEGLVRNGGDGVGSGGVSPVGVVVRVCSGVHMVLNVCRHQSLKTLPDYEGEDHQSTVTEVWSH